MSAPSPLPKYLYKILPSSVSLPKTALLASYTFPLTQLDSSSGYIHLSASNQLGPVLSHLFDADEEREVTLVRFTYESLSGANVGVGGVSRLEGGEAEGKQREIRWEKSEDEVFPHLYGGELEASDVNGVEIACREQRAWSGSEGGLKRWEEWEDVLERLRKKGWLKE